MVKIAIANKDGIEADFYNPNIKTARFYMHKLLPQTSTMLTTIEAGSESLMAFDEAYF